MPITFPHNYQIYLSIYLNTEPTFLIRLRRNHVPSHWAISPQLYLHITIWREPCSRWKFLQFREKDIVTGCQICAVRRGLQTSHLNLHGNFWVCWTVWGLALLCRRHVVCSLLLQYNLSRFDCEFQMWTHCLSIRNKSWLTPPSETTFLNFLPFQTLWHDITYNQ